MTLSSPSYTALANVKATIKMKTNNPKKALIVWYSQTGHTKRIGQIIADTWQKQGIKVDTSDIRNFDKKLMVGYDLIAMGSPVYYCNIPENAAKWLNGIPKIDGTPVVSFVTFGGPGDGQELTAAGILELLVDQGGFPVGMETFGNMSTFAPTWSMGNEKRILKYRHLPNQKTYEKARKYAETIIENICQGKPIEIKTKFNFELMLKYLPQAWFTKLLIGHHAIDENKCIGCGTCVEKCPVDALDPTAFKVDREACIVCFGCVNNCPSQAIDMEFMGKKVYGFNTFMKQNNIVIEMPEALKHEVDHHRNN